MAKWLHIAISAVLAALWIAVFVLKTEIPVLSPGLLSMTPFERVQIGVRFELPPQVAAVVAPIEIVLFLQPPPPPL